MFTGIIEEIGRVKRITRGSSAGSIAIYAKTVMNDIHLGDSISVNGVCLTVTDFFADCFTADVMHETLDRSTMGSQKTDDFVNLERAMLANGRFGGHIVSGHIDGIGTVSEIRNDDNAIWYTIKSPSSILRYVVEKGSIAIDGISLTVARVEQDSFRVSVIPHTASSTTLSKRRIGDLVNLENDCIGKYVEQLLMRVPQPSRITADFLMKNGF